MHSLVPEYIRGLSFSTEQLATIKRLGEARGRQDLFVLQSPEQLDVLRQAAIVESSESSNRIEGVTAAPGRVKALVLKSSEPRDRSEQEIAGYRDVLNLIHESHPHMAFTVNSWPRMRGNCWTSPVNRLILMSVFSRTHQAVSRTLGSAAM